MVKRKQNYFYNLKDQFISIKIEYNTFIIHKDKLIWLYLKILIRWLCYPNDNNLKWNQVKIINYLQNVNTN